MISFIIHCVRTAFVLNARIIFCRRNEGPRWDPPSETICPPTCSVYWVQRKRINVSPPHSWAECVTPFRKKEVCFTSLNRFSLFLWSVWVRSQATTRVSKSVHVRALKVPFSFFLSFFHCCKTEKSVCVRTNDLSHAISFCGQSSWTTTGQLNLERCHNFMCGLGLCCNGYLEWEKRDRIVFPLSFGAITLSHSVRRRKNLCLLSLLERKREIFLTGGKKGNPPSRHWRRNEVPKIKRPSHSRQKRNAQG